MSLLRPTRRWRPTTTDAYTLVAGAALIIGGLLLSWLSASSDLSQFLSDGLLSIGVAVALVGVLLRVQLDLEEELNEAKKARLRFEETIREELAIIDLRVAEALSLGGENADRDRANDRIDELRADLHAARADVARLERELVEAKGPKHTSILQPLRELKSRRKPRTRVRSAPSGRAAQRFRRARTRTSRLIRRHENALTSLTILLVIGFVAIGVSHGIRWHIWQLSALNGDVADHGILHRIEFGEIVCLLILMAAIASYGGIVRLGWKWTAAATAIVAVQLSAIAAITPVGLF